MQETQVIISLQKKKLFLKQANEQFETFPIAIGKSETPTPKGIYSIANKKILTDINVFGSHWLGLNLPGYGIHGTNHPEQIGQKVSNGCIRMHNTDIQYLFSRVHIGTTVIIKD